MNDPRKKRIIIEMFKIVLDHLRNLNEAFVTKKFSKEKSEFYLDIGIGADIDQNELILNFWEISFSLDDKEIIQAFLSLFQLLDFKAHKTPNEKLSSDSFDSLIKIYDLYPTD